MCKMFNCSVFYEIVLFNLQAGTYKITPLTTCLSSREGQRDLALINKKEFLNCYVLISNK